MRINQNGPSSYAKNVLLNVSKLDSRNNYTVIVNKEYSNFINADNFQVITSDIKPYRLREHWAIPNLLKARQFDLFHCMQYVSPLFINCPTLLTVYDTMHMEKSFWDDSIVRRVAGSYIRLISKISIKKAVGIVTISKYSATQISKVFGYDIKRIYPIHLGASSRYFNRNRDADSLHSMQKWGIKNPYLLCIGNMRPYKNIDILINAFSQLVSEGFKDVSLVLAGKASNEDMLKKQNIVSSLSLGDKVILIRNVNEEDLAALMGGASIFIFPSKNEGFGLPLLEAMATGAPSIASDIEVFRELCGDSVLYFQPHDASELKEKIIELLSSNGRKKQISSFGVTNAKNYSWGSTAIKTMSMYEELVNKIKK
jgi:glycosyltransferase involved in cell wall biosynthesis